MSEWSYAKTLGLLGAGALIARILIAVIFLGAAVNMITDFFGTIGYMTANMPKIPDSILGFLLLGAIAFLLFGGTGVLIGFHTRFSALLLVLFLLVVTPIFHAFWAASAEQFTIQMLSFQKNMAIMGGALMVLVFGPGPLSIDGWIRSRSASRNETLKLCTAMASGEADV